MQLITCAFPDKHRATEVLADLGDLDLDWGIPLDQAAAAITKSKRGKVRIHQSHEVASEGAFLGGLTGFVAGLLLLSPVIGTAIGAAAGGAIGSVDDPAPISGVDKSFLKQLGGLLANNSSAVLVFVPDARADAALGAIKAYDDGTIAETVVDADTEQAIRTAFESRRNA